MQTKPPALHLADWESTRDTLHQLAKILGKVRGACMPRIKHWWHITLAVSTHGLTTAPFPCGGGSAEINLDLVNHRVQVTGSEGWSSTLSISNRSPVELCRWITAVLRSGGCELEDRLLEAFGAEDPLPYDARAASRYGRGLCWVDGVFKRFQAGLREETSPVQVFPHHMDLAMSWYSGRKVAGIDPADEGQADEQLSFGFVTGDASVKDAYFYATAYPAPERWADQALPIGAYWHTEGWTGAVLPYEAAVTAENATEFLVGYLRNTQAHGASLMR